MAYSNAQRKAHIKEVQGYLYGISFFNENIPRIIPDGYFGVETVAAVKAFQKEYGLPITGEINKETWDKIVEVYNKLTNSPPEKIDAFPSSNYIIRLGSTGPIVYILQVMLATLSSKYKNINKINLNNTYDQQTMNAVRQIQLLTNLPVTGETDKPTWNIITSSFNSLNTVAENTNTNDLNK